MRACRILIAGLALVVGVAAARGAGGQDEGRAVFGLPPAPVPDGNALTPGKAALGRILYFERRLSLDNTTSCATCHNPKLGWTDHRPTVLGVREQLGARNAPTILNAAYEKAMFWDGRMATLEEQSKEPIANPREMGLSLEEAEKRVQSIPGYAPLFTAAFGDSKVTIDRIADAIASFERTVVSADSPYDRYLAGDRRAMTRAALRGKKLFNGKAKCAQCHTGPTFSDGRFHNVGVGLQRRVQDLGRFDVTKQESDRGAFKTPTLRNLGGSFPYMHDGSQATLAEVIDYFDKGGFGNQWLSADIKPLGLTSREKRDLLAFLGSLDGTNMIVEPPEEFPR